MFPFHANVNYRSPIVLTIHLDGPLTLAHFSYIYIYIKLDLSIDVIFSKTLSRNTALVEHISIPSPRRLSRRHFLLLLIIEAPFIGCIETFGAPRESDGKKEDRRLSGPFFRCNNPECFQISSANDVRLERVGTLRPISRSP